MTGTAHPGAAGDSWPPVSKPSRITARVVVLHRFHDRVDLDRVHQVVGEVDQQAQADEQQDECAADG